MGDIDDLFSPEALRLLDEFINDSHLTSEPSGSLLEADLLALDLPEFLNGSDLNFEPSGRSLDAELPLLDVPNQEDSKREPSHKTNQITGYSTLEIPGVTVKNRKRAKFDERSRQKVANVRKKGACMRCRTLKIPVSAPRARQINICSDIVEPVFW